MLGLVSRLFIDGVAFGEDIGFARARFTNTSFATGMAEKAFGQPT
jgi:hypothetical protein